MSREPETLCLPYFPKNPSPHLTLTAEKEIQSFCPSFTLENDFIIALFKANHPALSLKAFELWKKESDENKRTIFKSISTLYQIQMIKQLNLTEEELLPVLPKLLSLLNQKEAIASILDLAALICSLKSPPDSCVDAILDLYIPLFGVKPEIYPLLAKSERHLLKSAREYPEDALKTWQAGLSLAPKAEAHLLSTLILFLQNDQAIPLFPALNRDLLDKKQGKLIADKIDTLKTNPKVLISEALRCIQKKAWSQAHNLLLALLNQAFEEQDEVKRIMQQLPTMPETLLLHPNIQNYFTPEELLSLFTLNLTPSLTQKGLKLFPSQDETANQNFVKQILKRRYVPSGKATSYVLTLKEQEFVQKWMEQYPPQALSQEDLKNYLQLNHPQASAKIRQLTTKETLEALKEEYEGYIPSTEEIKEWLTLILDAEAPHLFPFVEWMEKCTPPIELFMKCIPFSFPDEERLKRCIASLKVDQTTLSEIMALYSHYNLFTASNLSPFITEALHHPSVEIKKKVLRLCQQFAYPINSSTITLYVQLKDESLFDLMKLSLTPDLTLELAKGAAQISLHSLHVVLLLNYRDEHQLPDDAPFLSLLVSSNNIHLMKEGIDRLSDRLKNQPEKVKENFKILEALIKNENIGAQLQSLIESINIDNLEHSQMLSFIRILCLNPKEFTMRSALEAAFLLLHKQVNKDAANIFCKLFELALKMEGDLCWDIYLCLTHPGLLKVLTINKIDEYFFEVLEKVLTEYKDFESVCKVVKMMGFHYPIFHKYPHKEKKFQALAYDALLSMQAGNDVDVATLLLDVLFKIPTNPKRISRQAASYCNALNITKTPFNPAHFPGNPKDALFENALVMIDKILKCSPHHLDNNHQLYDFISVQLSLLICCYCENVKELIPYIYRYMFMQLPSGYDVVEISIESKWKLLRSVLTVFKPKPDCYQEILESCCLVSDQLTVINLAPEEHIKAFKKVIYQLIQHPSPQGVCYAMALMHVHEMELLAIKNEELVFLLKKATEAVLKDPLYPLQKGNLIYHSYVKFLITLCYKRTEIALSCLQTFFSRLNSLIEESDDYVLTSSVVLGLKLCAGDQIFTMNYPIFLSFLTQYTNAVLKQGKRNRSFQGHLTKVASLCLCLHEKDRREVATLISTILMNLKRTPSKDFGSYLNIVCILQQLKGKPEVFKEVYVRINQEKGAGRSSL